MFLLDKSQKPQERDQEFQIYYYMGNMKVVINKSVILPKLRKELEQVDFSFKKWYVAVHIR